LLNDHTSFQTQKQEILELITSQSKTLTDKVKSMHYRSVMKTLEKNNMIQIDHKCQYCDYIGHNKAGCSAHERKCEKKQMMMTDNVVGNENVGEMGEKKKPTIKNKKIK